MAVTVIGGIIKAARGVVKVVKGVAEGDGEEITKGAVKIIRGTGRIIGGVVTGEVYQGRETADEAEEEY